MATGGSNVAAVWLMADASAVGTRGMSTPPDRFAGGGWTNPANRGRIFLGCVRKHLALDSSCSGRPPFR